jgi:hypothetical protein
VRLQMKTLRFLHLLVLLSFLVACSRTYKLSEKDFTWIPYKGKDTLTFASNTGDTDTLYIGKGERYMYSAEPFDITPDTVEHFYLLYRLVRFQQKINGTGPIQKPLLPCIKPKAMKSVLALAS